MQIATLCGLSRGILQRMDTAYLPALALFALVQTGTPGPNNLMLLASGANFGYRRTIPHILGIAAGVAVRSTPSVE